MMQLQLKKESDLYSPYDPSGRMIHTQVYDYLKTFCTEAESKKHIHDTLQIVSEEPIDAVRAKQAIRDAVQRDIAQFDAQIERNRKMALRDLITGVLLTILGITLYVILNQFLLAIISFLGTIQCHDDPDQAKPGHPAAEIAAGSVHGLRGGSDPKVNDQRIKSACGRNCHRHFYC